MVFFEKKIIFCLTRFSSSGYITHSILIANNVEKSLHYNSLFILWIIWIFF